MSNYLFKTSNSSISRLLLTAIFGIASFLSASLLYAQNGINVTVSAGTISASVADSNVTSLTVRVAGPGDFSDRLRGEGGSVTWYLPSGAPDGSYRFDVYGSSGDDEGGAGANYRQHGRFTVEGGSMSDQAPVMEQPQSSNEHKSNSLLSRVIGGLIDFVIPSAHAANLTASDALNPIVFFDETDGGTGADWSIGADGDGILSAGCGGNTTGFAIFDDVADACRKVFEIQDGLNSLNTFIADDNGDISLADGSIVIDKSANAIGIGDISPTEAISIVNTNTPGILLDDNGTGVWRMEEFLDDLRFTDITDAITSLTLDGANGRVGIGTTAPLYALHVFRNDGTASLRVEESGVFAGRVLQRLTNNGPVALYLEDTSVSGGTWSFTQNANNFVINNVSAGGLKIVAGADNSYRVQNKGSGIETFKVLANGNTVIAGILTTGSSRSIKDNINTVEHSNILSKLDELPVSYWNYKTTNADDRHIGPMAEDFYATFGLGTSEKHIAPTDIAGIALAAAKALNEKSAIKDEQIRNLSEENAELAKTNDQLNERMQALEAKVADLIQVVTMKEAANNTVAAAQ